MGGEVEAMQGSRAPKRILNARRFLEISPWECPRFRSVAAVRTLRKWLADPNVPDELRLGDAELLAALEWFLKEHREAGMSPVAEDQFELFESTKGQTLH